MDQLTAQTLLDALVDHAAVLDAEGVIRAVNRRWRDFARANGGSDGSYVGVDYLAVCEAAGVGAGPRAQQIAEGLRAVLAGRSEFRCEYPCHAPGERRWFELVATPLNPGALVVHRNVTAPRIDIETLEHERALAHDFAALVAASGDAIISFDLDGRILSWNAAAERLYGYDAQEAIGASMEMLYPPQEARRIGDFVAGILAGTLRSFEVVRRARSGELIDVAVSAAPIRGADGQVAAISNIHRDVTGAKRKFERQEFVARELAHRFKNMLTVVSSIASQTARRAATVEAFRDAFLQRLGGLARSSDLLLGSQLGGATLRALVTGHLAPFAPADDARVTIRGEDVALRPEAVHALGMALHELSTNAVKYGALRAQDGRLSIDWAMRLDDDLRSLTLVWSERAAAIRPATGRGFGRTVLTTLTQRALGAQIDYRIEDGALDWRIELPRAHFDPLAPAP